MLQRESDQLELASGHATRDALPKTTMIDQSVGLQTLKQD
jgi:hypothetical protein